MPEFCMVRREERSSFVCQKLEDFPVQADPRSDVDVREESVYHLFAVLGRPQQQSPSKQAGLFTGAPCEDTAVVKAEESSPDIKHFVEIFSSPYVVLFWFRWIKYT